MELICVEVWSRKLNFIVSICLEKFCRQRQLFYLLCFKAFQKHLWNEYCGVPFSKGWRKYSATSAEMNFFVQTFSLKRIEGRHNFFIYFDSKLFLRADYSGALFQKVASSSICNCSRNELQHVNFVENVPKAKAIYFICLFSNKCGNSDRRLQCSSSLKSCKQQCL